MEGPECCGRRVFDGLRVSRVGELPRLRRTEGSILITAHLQSAQTPGEDSLLPSPPVVTHTHAGDREAGRASGFAWVSKGKLHVPATHVPARHVPWCLWASSSRFPRDDARFRDPRRPHQSAQPRAPARRTGRAWQ